MAGSPRFKAFTPSDEYTACFKHLEDAAAFVAYLGEGATIRDGHSKKLTLWTEGSEEFSANESFDGAAEVMLKRIKARIQEMTELRNQRIAEYEARKAGGGK